MNKLHTAVVVAVALTGCQTTGQTDQALLTRQIVPPDHRQQIVRYFEQSLKDPYSIRSAEISPPRTDFTGLLNGGERQAICVKFNAKNSFGAYVGIRRHVIWFNDGKFGGQLEEPLGCNSTVTYGPFPELERIAQR